jgi:hypothetical protein
MDTPGSPYLSELVALPAPAAAIALDAHRLDVVGFRTDDPEVLLTLTGSGTTTATGTAYEAVRHLSGVLQFGRASIDVELELLPWSARASELALRPSSGGFPRTWTGARHAAYAKAVVSVLRGLVAELELAAVSPARPTLGRTVAA